MSLVAAKCPQCGASIQVESGREAEICAHCGTAFVTEKAVAAVSNFNTSIVQNITKHIHGNEKNEADDYIKSGESYLTLKAYEKAYRMFEQSLDLYPSNWRGWLGLAQAGTRGFSVFPTDAYIGFLEKAERLADGADAAVLSEATKDVAKNREAYTAAEKAKHDAQNAKYALYNKQMGKVNLFIILGAMVLMVGAASFLVSLLLCVVIPIWVLPHPALVPSVSAVAAAIGAVLLWYAFKLRKQAIKAFRDEN
jgi:tetratricopeptide (TPR) repeat protein